uniref:MSP domain-containing protein n=1 Tax=Panagrolaimus sp. PS1159 TaxID=55785 RepID=A0AC35FV61_9BILA
MSTQALAVEPPCCPISAAGGKSKHKLINQSSSRLAYKVKSKSSFSVAHHTVAGKPKADKLVIMFNEAPADATDASKFFEANAPKTELTGEFILKLSAAE